MSWKMVIHFFLLASMVFLCAGKLILKPRDTDAMINHSTHFNCTTDIMSSDIFWFHGNNYIYTGSVILEPYNERFKIERYTRNRTFSNNLIIQSVQPGDAGEYTCVDEEGIGETCSVQFVVLDGDPICRSNIELHKVIGQNSCNVEPDEVELSCSVMYHGNIHPQLEWKKDGDENSISEGLSNAISGNRYNYILKLKGDTSLDKAFYVCQATRFALEPSKCISKVITVFYALSDNSTINKTIDDEILCLANSTQSCNYKWRWFGDNYFTTESTSAMLKPQKPGLHRCEAECYLSDKTCNLLVMEAMVYDDKDSSQTMNAIVSVSVVVMLVLVVALICIFHFRIAKNRVLDSEPNLELALLPKQNIGSASALSYFSDYLRIVLPDFKNRLIEQTLSNYLDILPKTVQKMLIIMPDSCVCVASLVVPTKIELTGQFVHLTASRAGNLKPDYQSSLYKLIDHEKHEEYYFVGEFATPLLTMYEMCTSALCGMTKDQLYVERDAFCSTLRDIFSHPDNAECNDQFKLLKWSDPETKKPNQMDIYNFLLLELRKEIKLQRDDRACSSISEMIDLPESKFHIMGAGKSMNFDPAVLEKYTAPEHSIKKGAPGNVFGPISWQDSQLAVRKALFADGKVTVDFKKCIEAKKVIWTSLRHKNLMRIHWVDLTRLPKVMFLVMDFAAGGSLHETLGSLGPTNKLPIDVVTNWAKQIAKGMLYLHEKDIIHRDLKSSKILLMEPFDVGNPHNMLTLKIADFDEIKEHDHTATMSTFVGTCAYMAPEVLKDQWFSKASDAWSFGVVLWEMLSGDVPHKGLEPNAIMAKSISGELDNLPVDPSFPEDFKLLLRRCWENMHTGRISFHDISSILQRIGLPEKYKSDPVLIETIRAKVGEEGNKLISGLTILGKELFVVSAQSSQIEVYDSMKLCFNRRFNLDGLRNPIDIASCSRNTCLYIFDSYYIEKSMEILRVGPSGNLIKKWSTGYDDGWSLSVTYESNVILILKLENKLNEYSPDGQLISQTNLSGVGIRCPWHAIKLTNGHFVVSHGSRDGDLHRVCSVDADGKLVKSFGGKRGSSIKQMNRPVYLFVDEDGFVLVADQENHRVLLLDSNLEFKGRILTKAKHGLQYPRRILLDESTSRVFVGERGFDGPMKIFNSRP